MTTLEYMEKQLEKHLKNLEREKKRNVPAEQIVNIENKIIYYGEAIVALKEVK